MVGESCDRKTNRQENLHQNEGQFQPEADPQDAVFPEMDAQLLIFGTGEDRRQDDASDEQEQKPLVSMRVVQGVEAGK